MSQTIRELEVAEYAAHGAKEIEEKDSVDSRVKGKFQSGGHLAKP